MRKRRETKASSNTSELSVNQEYTAKDNNLEIHGQEYPPEKSCSAGVSGSLYQERCLEEKTQRSLLKKTE